MKKSRLKKKRGAAIVEFAIVVPLILLVVVAVVNINALIYLKQSSKIACYEGCRVGIVRGANSENVEAQVTEILNSRRVKDYTIAITPNDVQSMVAGDILTVQVEVLPQSNLFFAGQFASGSMNCSVSMRCEL